MQKENIAYQKAYQFAIRIVTVYQFLTEAKKEFVISKQLLKNGTSVGANIAEANGAISKAGKIGKIQFTILKSTRIKDH